MCGILLIIKKNNNFLDKKRINESFATLFSRGSEFQKIIFFDEHLNEISYNSNFKVAMGHSRFVTYDFNSNANMPFKSEEIKKYIIFNGDIYNHYLLKNNLKNLYSFKTKSDTEVLLNIYDKYGLETHNKLNGDYAYIILDKIHNDITVSIDRFTSKPLFKYENKDIIVISSEIKTIFKLKLDIFCLKKNFVKNYIDTNFWLFNEKGSVDAYKNIEQLTGNKYYKINLKNFTTSIIEQEFNLIEFKNKDEVTDIILDSVKLRKESDRKIGVLISGGIDSSTIANLLKDEPNIDYFYTDTNDNDSYYAKYVIDQLNLNAKRLEYNNDNLLKNINELNDTYSLPTPIYGESLGMYSLYKNIREKYGKYILLTGHGGDEIFGGNFLFINVLEEIFKNKGFVGLIRFLKDINIPQGFIKEILLFLLNKLYFVKGNYRFYEQNKIRDLKERQLFELNFANVRQSSLINDINSIHNDISTRSPLMDYRLKSVINFDIDNKIDLNKDRIILRNILKDDLPELYQRVDKQGMRVNFLKNFRLDFPDIKNYILSNESNFFSKSFLEKSLNVRKLDKKLILRIFSIINLENNLKV